MTPERSGAVTAARVVVGAAARSRLLESRAEVPITPTAALTAFEMLSLMSRKIFSRPLLLLLK